MTKATLTRLIGHHQCRVEKMFVNGKDLSPVHWTNTDRRYKQSTAFISCNRKIIQIIHDEELNMHQQTRLLNRCAKVDIQPSIILRHRVEVELQSN